jgi:prepilin-type N-terminal cleavage/methylation domain-containing protein
MHTNSRFYGFTLIELMVVISIIGVLASVVLASTSAARESAQYTKAKLDIKNIAGLIELAKGTSNSSLVHLTGSSCSECACRQLSGSNSSPTTVNIQRLPASNPCVASYMSLIEILNDNTGGLYSIKSPPLDPWGAPYLINENEGEGGPFSGGCWSDNIASAGPNGLYYDTDDIVYNVPPMFCDNAIAHQPNINW